MKVAVFGDSYGVNMSHHNSTLSWVDIVKTEYNLDNFCEGGSSLYYQYTLFLDNHLHYDKIIFLVTNQGRMYLKDCDVQKHVSHYDTAEHWYNKATSSKDKLILKSALNYFLYLQNNNFDKLIHRLILEEIKNNRQDILFVPCFEHDSNTYKNNLMNACRIDWSYYDIRTPETYIDKRHCHMNQINNEILAKEIINYLRLGSFDLDNCNWLTDDKPLGFYFEKL